ncbi:cupin domain-containing protein [Roseiarcaceae bacterium H3SJ34-1]|uniref:cupin domain-containing protein n=1 Tax=Terripilifer ovatus TaxID=3032367 RepID=UPI003AB94B9D|nr:cupin domain-containing protein [Roseiarcaceae bacterium H3SJ34-1]
MAVSKDIRRVVTTVDENGKAVVLFDGPNPNTVVRPQRGTVSRLMWVTGETPADIAGPVDRGDARVGIAPPPNGSVFRIIDIPPITAETEALPVDYHASQHGASTPKRHMRPRHPLMHATRSLDYALVLEGEIDMLLDDSEVHLKAGEVVIQQGTNHAWVNRGTEVCRIAFVLIDGQEP